MKILLTGRTGQVGWELERALPSLGEVIATDRAALDLSMPAQIRDLVRRVRPGLIVNAAAYTAVDGAESEKELARAINGAAPGVLAEEALRSGALLVHYSTDYVFDGSKPGPYDETDATAPLNVYGSTKLEGERAIRRTGCRHLIFRTSWVYAERGRNFLLTMLRLAAQGKKQVRVVDDQTGAPTSSAMIASATVEVVRRALDAGVPEGVYHMSAQGAVTWCGFARAIFQGAGLAMEVLPIASADYPAAARRPRNSLLDNSKLAGLGVRLPSWPAGLEAVLAQVGR